MGSPSDRITLAVECVGTKHSGGATILRDLLSVLADDPRFSRVLVYTTPRGERTFDLPVSEKVQDRPRSREESSYAARIGWYLRGLGEACRLDGSEVLLCANGMGLAGKLPRVALVQQALPFSREALATLPVAQRLRMGFVRLLTCHSLRSATAVVAQSQVMVETLRSACKLHHKKMGVCRPTVELRPEGGGHAVRIAMEACPGDRRLLYVGSTAPYKNLKLVTNAISVLRAAVPGATLFLTCEPQESLGQAVGVIPLGYLDPPALATAYDMATVVVQPSLIESGPLAPPEAMCAGRPLLAADRPWARDACREGAVYFDPSSAEDFIRQAERLLKDSTLRAALVCHGAAWQEQIRRENPYRELANLLVWAWERSPHRAKETKIV